MAKKRAKTSSAKKSAKPAKPRAKAQAKLDTATDAALKRLSQINKLGRQIARKKADVEARETAVASATAARKKAMDDRNEAQRELDALREDMDKLSVGGFSERLPFPEAAETTSDPAQVVKPENVQTAPAADPDAWRSLKLEAMGLTDKRALKALEAAGIETFGQAEDRLADVYKPIPNFGDGARQKYDDAKIAYFVKNPQPASGDKPNGKHTAPGDQPGEASRGAAVDRARKELDQELDNLVAFGGGEVTPENGMKLLARALGVESPEQALATATLNQIAGMRDKVKSLPESDVKALFTQAN